MAYRKQKPIIHIAKIFSLYLKNDNLLHKMH
jgi:hypothetical protein